MKKIVWLDPKDALIVGIDCPVDDFPELADPEREPLRTPEYLEGLAESMREFGPQQAITVIQQGKLYYVRDGRCRTLAGRLIEDFKIPAFVAASATSLDVAAANTWHLEEPPWVKAARADRLRRMGKETDQIVVAMQAGSKMQLSHWKHLLNCHPDIMKRIQAGELTVTLGYDLGKHTQKKQLEILQKIEAGEGTTKGRAGIENVRDAADDDGEPIEPRKAHSPKLPKYDRLEDLFSRLEATEDEPYSTDVMKGAHLMIGVILGKMAPSVFDDKEIRDCIKFSHVVKADKERAPRNKTKEEVLDEEAV